MYFDQLYSIFLPFMKGHTPDMYVIQIYVGHIQNHIGIYSQGVFMPTDIGFDGVEHFVIIF